MAVRGGVGDGGAVPGPALHAVGGGGVRRGRGRLAAQARDARGGHPGGRRRGHRRVVHGGRPADAQRGPRNPPITADHQIRRRLRHARGFPLPVAGRGRPHLAVVAPYGPVAVGRARARPRRAPDQPLAPLVHHRPGPRRAGGRHRNRRRPAVLGAHRLQLLPARHRRRPPVRSLAARLPPPARPVRLHPAGHPSSPPAQRGEHARRRPRRLPDPGRVLRHHGRGLLVAGPPLTARARGRGAHARLRHDQRHGPDGRPLRSHPRPQPGGRPHAPEARPPPPRPPRRHLRRRRLRPDAGRRRHGGRPHGGGCGGSWGGSECAGECVGGCAGPAGGVGVRGAGCDGVERAAAGAGGGERAVAGAGGDDRGVAGGSGRAGGAGCVDGVAQPAVSDGGAGAGVAVGGGVGGGAECGVAGHRSFQADQ
ncbi:hypothetical protein PS9374_07039 [Planomonospora sphaerica]|uniref:Uncharacterized protein n=1 Tax=Planomonospora sphaerica TaxID=161355 RepID=A0A171DQK7_9ACTN|nr:hypothetical protein PS9374_07039 [Planomonospora sphaerica]